MERSNQELGLVTLNCLGVPFVRHARARLTTIGRELNEAGLDIVCLQEIQYRRYIPLLLDAFSNFPYHAYEPFLHAPKGGLVTFSRFPVERQRFELYEKRGHITSPALADWILHKGALITEFVLAGLPVVIVNTHLIANYRADWSARNRYVRHQEAELRQLTGILGTIAPEALTIVVGDFNLPTNTRLYREFVRTAQLHDPLAENPRPTYRPPPFLPGRYAHTFDHVLIRPPRGRQVDVAARLVFEERQRLVNGRHAHLSDHIGIFSRVRLPGADGAAPARDRG